MKKLLEWEQLALLAGASDEEVQADYEEETTYRPEDRTVHEALNWVVAGRSKRQCQSVTI